MGCEAEYACLPFIGIWSHHFWSWFERHVICDDCDVLAYGLYKTLGQQTPLSARVHSIAIADPPKA